MELTAYELALIAGGFGIAGTLLGVLGAYRLSINLAERQFQHLREISKLDAWHAAARDFIEAFAGDIAIIEAQAEPPGDIMDYLRSEHARHARAVAIFERFVAASKRASFKSEWQAHCYGKQDSGQPDSPESAGMSHEHLLFLHYSNEYNLRNRTSARCLAVEQIRKLLSYAEET